MDEKTKNTNDSICVDLETALQLLKGSPCTCDEEVGWTCEACFVQITVYRAKKHLEKIGNLGDIQPR